MTPGQELKLDDLRQGTPGITQMFGGSLCEAASVCLEVCAHQSGVSMTVSGDLSSHSLQVTWSPTNQQVRNCYADLQFATEFGAYGIAVLLTGISVLAARIRTLIHQCRVRTARFLHPRLFRSQLPSAAAALEGKPTGALAFRAFLRHRSTLVSFLRPGGLRCTRPRVSLPAPVAPRSSAAYRRTAAGSGALPPAGASSTAHASPTGPRFSPAAAGDS